MLPDEDADLPIPPPFGLSAPTRVSESPLPDVEETMERGRERAEEVRRERYLGD